MLPTVLPTPYREKMSTVDTAWLRMDSATNLMMIVAVLLFDKAMDGDRFRATMVNRLLPYRRFRSRVVSEFGGSWWQGQEVDLDRHIVHCRMKTVRPDNKAALEQLVSTLSATPLDPQRPLWQMHLVDNCIGTDGRVRQAVIIRIHHCIADGIALVGVLLSMFDGSPDAPPQPLAQASRLAQLADQNPWHADHAAGDQNDDQGDQLVERDVVQISVDAGRSEQVHGAPDRHGASHGTLDARCNALGVDGKRQRDAAEGPARRHQACGLERAIAVGRNQGDRTCFGHVSQ